MEKQLDLFPAFVRPKKGEIFSSWLVRNAHSHELKVHTFYKLISPKNEIWTRDIDKSAKNSFLNFIAKKCDTPLPIAEQTLLSSYSGIIFEKLVKNVMTRWTTQCGIYHRLRKNKYISFCSSCLRNDPIPYFRKSWRLTLLNNCCECRQTLRNCCPICENPICFYRADIGDKMKYPGASLCTCTFCGFDIRECEPLEVSPRNLANQRWIESTMESGHFLCGEWVSSVDTFNVLFLLSSALRGKHFRFAPLQNAVLRETKTTRFGTCSNVFDLESDINNRNEIINGAIYLLNEWPDRFLRICFDNNITYSAFNRFTYLNTLPEWFNKNLLKIRIS